MATEPRRYRFSIEEFEQLGVAGIFTEDDRVELLDGEIIEMAPIDPRHARCTGRLTRLLVNQTGDDLLVSVQNPVRVGTQSEPLPDLVVYPDRPYPATPAADAVLLVIEVSDSTVAFDRREKFPRYAAAGIAEAWLVDINAGIIERHTAPGPDGYGVVTPFRAGETVTSTVLPGLTVAVDTVFG